MNSHAMNREAQQYADALEQKTRSLEMLYSIASSLNLIHDPERLYPRILSILKEWIDAEAVSMHARENEHAMRVVANLGFEVELNETHPVGNKPECPCKNAIAKGYVQHSLATRTCCGDKAARSNEHGERLRLVSVPVQSQSRVLGVIVLLVSDEHLEEIEEWVVVLTSIGQNLGLAMERSELEKKSQRLLRMEERAYLAHELHDCLAQTLASMRYQVRILDDALQNSQESEAWDKLKIVENTVEESNREIRRLIDRFRAPIDEGAVVPSIEDAVRLFEKETGVRTVFQKSTQKIDLPLEVESQIVRIVQEALANIREHAKAKAVRVMLQCDANRGQVLIEDDGIGFEAAPKEVGMGEHIGLSVMRERAARIHGKLTVESDPSEGTRVRVVFPIGERRLASQSGA